jgi:hypothetical protein
MAKTQAKKVAKKAARKTKKEAKQSKEQLTIAILVRARELLSKRGGWGKDLGAADKEGNEVATSDKTACKFCATGALDRAIYDLTGEIWAPVKPYAELLGFVGCGALENWNDERTSKRPVLALFSSAIARLEGQA